METSSIKSNLFNAYRKTDLNRAEFKGKEKGEQAGRMKEAKGLPSKGAMVEFSSDGMAALRDSKKTEDKSVDDYIAEIEERLKAAKDTASANESGLSEKAKNFLEKLRGEYGDYDFFVAKDGDDVEGILGQSDKSIAVAFSSEEIEKMAEDEEYAAKVMDKVKSVEDMTKKMSEELDESGLSIKKLSVSFDSEGKMSIFAELEKASKEQDERLSKIKENKKEEKKAAEKKEEASKLKKAKAEPDKTPSEEERESFEIKASSEEELFNKLKELMAGYDKSAGALTE